MSVVGRSCECSGWFRRDIVASMTRDELLERLRSLRDAAVDVDTDLAAICAVMVRMCDAGDDLAPLTEAALDVEASGIRTRETRRLSQRN
jgi:hypothetical protein